MQAKDVMTRKVISVGPDDTILHAIRLMLQHKISGLPVIDGAGRVVGIVTEGDFLRRAETGTVHRAPRWIEFLMGPGPLATEYVHASGRKVREVMTAEVHTVTEDTALEKVVSLMQHYHIKRVPVARDGEIIGIITRANLMRALAKTSLAAEQRPAANDREIRDRLREMLGKQPWAPIATIVDST